MSDAAVATVITEALTQEFEDFFRKHFDLVHSVLLIEGVQKPTED